jgi:hypothetical protein
VPDVFAMLLGVPWSRERRARVMANVMGDLKGAQAVSHIVAGVQHNTDKAGALLAAQGIFAVACTYGIDHGWPKLLAVPAILLLLSGSLLAMSILRSTASVFDNTDQTQALRAMLELLMSRMMRFNLALHMTFLSIVLLAAAALSSLW